MKTACLLLCLLVAPAWAGDVITVPGDAVTVQAAVDRAGPGDVVLIGKGDHAGPISIIGKGVSLVARYPNAFTRLGAVLVHAVPESETVVLRGLRLLPAGGSSLELYDNAGAIRVEDCEMSASPGKAGTRVELCASVVLTGCTSRGAAKWSGSAWPPAGTGLLVRSSNVAVYGSLLEGGKGWGGFSGAPSGPGGSGVLVEDDPLLLAVWPRLTAGEREPLLRHVHIEGSTVRGGPGGDSVDCDSCCGFDPPQLGCCGPCTTGGQGGAGLRLDAITVSSSVRDDVITGGPGGYGWFGGGASGKAVSIVSGELVSYPEPYRDFQATSPVVEGRPVKLALDLEPGDQALVAVSPAPTFADQPALQGVLLAGAPFARLATDGMIAPTLPPGTVGLDLHLQLLVHTDAGPLLGPASVLTVLDERQFGGDPWLQPAVGASGKAPGVTAESFPAGDRPRSVVVDDLDADGAPDLIVASESSDDVSVLKGVGDGGFSAATSLPTGARPWSVAVGDLNGDGVSDLVVAASNSADVSVHLGLGDGGFAAPQTYAAGNSPSAVTIADVDGDGAPDVVVALRSDDAVALLRGLGDGSFDLPETWETGDTPVGVTVDDMDGDGLVELVIANEDSDDVSVLKGLGGGRFVNTSTQCGNRPRSVAVGDLDGDGIPDLVVADEGDDTVTVLRGQGAGTFEDGVGFPVGDDPQAVVIGDLDGDGIPDLAVANKNSDDVSVLRGLGGGAFAAPLSVPAADKPRSIERGDLDGDGVLDLVVATAAGGLLGSGTTIWALHGLGDGTFTVAQAAPSFAGSPASVTLGDLDGDGVPDLVTATTSSHRVHVLLGQGDGTFTVAPSIPFTQGSRPREVAIEDLDGDGAPDLAVVLEDFDEVAVMLGAGDGTFSAGPVAPAGDGPRSVVTTDVDGDGVPDLLVAASDTDQMTVLTGLGDGSFTSSGTFPTGNRPLSVAAADLDGDGHPDAVLANILSDDVTVLLGSGDGDFSVPTRIPVGDGPRSVATDDLDGDGVPDLVVAAAQADVLVVLPGLGGLDFGAPVLHAVGTEPSAVAIADLDDDGDPDLVVADYVSDDVAVLLNQGDGSFATANTLPAGDGPWSVAVEDVDGDGALDIVVANSESDDVTVILGYGDGGFAPPPIIGIPL